MDKNAIKKFAVWARTELIARVSLKGVEYGITEDNIEDANADSVGGKVLAANEKKQRQALIAEINDKGYKQVMEEVAYTWFNRFSALRFMEVNGYLPSHVRVFTDEENNFKPQIITEAIHLDLDGLDMEKVYELKDAEKSEELYKYLLIVQCQNTRFTSNGKSSSPLTTHRLPRSSTILGIWIILNLDVFIFCFNSDISLSWCITFRRLYAPPQGKASAGKEGQRLAVLGYFNKRADIPCFDTLNRVLYRKRHDTP